MSVDVLEGSARLLSGRLDCRAVRACLVAAQLVEYLVVVVVHRNVLGAQRSEVLDLIARLVARCILHVQCRNVENM